VTRIAMGLLAAVMLVVTGGAIFQAVTHSADQRALRPPGRLVDVAGKAMHIDCRGEGRPTLVLEAGAGGYAQMWSWIAPQLAARARVCSYDRAGLGWSAPAAAMDGAASADRLHFLLTNAGERGPYVLVGHSMGGPFIRIYEQAYPDEVVGLVFVDSSHPDQFTRLGPEAAKQKDAGPGLLRLAEALTYVGATRVLNIGVPTHLPAEAQRAARLFATSPSFWRASREELEAWDVSMAAARASATLGDKPILVISAGATMPGMTEPAHQAFMTMHDEIATLSTRATRLTIPAATHLSLLAEPAHADQVADAILAYLDAARPGP